MIISVDHGNKSIKTPNALFTSGLIVSEGLQGFKTDYICWNNKYYTLTEQRIAYLRDKMQDRPMCVQHPLGDLRAVVDDMRMAGDTMWEARRGELTVAVAICRSEADGVLLRECVYDDEAARDGLVAAIAAHYGITAVDVLDDTGLVGDYFGMARVINAEAMLAAYAALHPEMTLALHVTDEQLVENDGCYLLADGRCERLVEPCIEAEPFTIAQLTHRVLAEENPLMNLMMND